MKRSFFGLSKCCLVAVSFLIGLHIAPSGWSISFDFLRPLHDPNPSNGNRFGARLQVFSQDSVAVGSYSAEVDGFSAGVLYLYNPQTGSIDYSYSNPFPDQGDFFGCSSVQTKSGLLVIGALFDDGGNGVPSISNSGSIYVYNGTSHEFLRRLQSPNAVAEGRFSEWMAAYGNYVLIGAPGDIANGASGGAAYLIDPANGEVVHTFQNPTPNAGDLFGYRVAVSDHKCLIAARGDDTAGTDAGAAYIFDIDSGTLLQTLLNPSPNPNDSFGISVTFVPDMAIVGARDEDTPVENSGAVYVFNEQTGLLKNTIICPDPGTNARFGVVSASGSNLLVGATGVTVNGLSSSGAAYLFDLSDGSLIQSFYNPEPSAGDSFGEGSCLSSDLILVGASFDDTNQAFESGSAYVYQLANGQPSMPVVDITPDEPTPDDDLFCSASWSVDPEGATVTYSYAWYSDGVLIETNGFDSVTGPSLSHVYTARNQVIECRVTPNDGVQDGPYGSGSVVIRDLPPTVPLVDVTPDKPYTLDNLYCSASGSTDREGALVTYSYAWYRDGVLIESDGFHPVTGPSLSNIYTTRDQTIECRVTPNDGYQDGPQASDSVVILNTPPPTPVFRLLPEVPTPDDGLAVYLENPDPVDVDGDLVIPLFVWSQSTDGSTWVVRPELSGRLTPVFIQGEPEISSLYTQIAEYWRVDVSYMDFKNETAFNKAVTTGDLSLLEDKDTSEVESEITFILPDLDGDNQVGPADMVLLESVWGDTQSEMPSSLRPLFFETTDPANARVSLRELLGLGGLGWYLTAEK